MSIKSKNHLVFIPFYHSNFLQLSFHYQTQGGGEELKIGKWAQEKSIKKSTKKYRILKRKQTMSSKFIQRCSVSK